MKTILDDILSPAKLNLFLHVIGQRKDGYHLLQSVMVLIDWCDVLHFELRQDGKIQRHDMNVQLPQEDLTIRAARLLQQKSNSPFGIDISLEKHIPIQAGLGGGSSNAAITLLALNQLWHLHLPIEDLYAIGSELGADVPFFLHNGPAWVEGIGEKLSPVKLPKEAFEQSIGIIKPKTGVSTQQIFSHQLLTKNTEPVTISDFVSHAFKCTTDPSDYSAFNFGCNDLQIAAQAVEPQIKEAIDKLSLYAGITARMTGSGSAVFAPIRNKFEQAEQSTNFTLPSSWLFKKCKILVALPQAKKLIA